MAQKALAIGLSGAQDGRALFADRQIQPFP
jgi:hypothetical protein